MAGAPQGGAPQMPQTPPAQGGAPQPTPTLGQGVSTGFPPQGQGLSPWLSQLGALAPQAQPAPAPMQPPQGLPPGMDQVGGGMQQYIQQLIAQAQQGPGADLLTQLRGQQNVPPQAPPQAQQSPTTLPPQMAANINRLIGQNGPSPWMMQKRPQPSGQRIAGNPTAMEIGGQGLGRIPRDRSTPR